MICDGGYKVIEKRFESFLNKYQSALKTSLTSKNFILDFVHFINRFGSYIDFPDWIKSEKATINPINKNIINPFNTL